MKRFMVGLLALIGALAIVSLLAVGLLGVLSLASTEGVSRGTIVELDLDGAVVEWVPNEPFARALLGKQPTVREVVAALDRAAEDDRVTGVFARIGDLQVGFARIQELRDAVVRFRESGKPIVAWADTFGEFGPGNGGYYLASAFERVHMQPSGSVGLTGLAIESSFRRGLYEKFGIEAEMGQRHEFKNAMNVHTETAFTAPHKEALDVVIESLFGQIVRGVASGRDLGEDVVREAIDRAPLIGQAAVEAGLVDGLAYRDEALDALRERAGDGELLYATKYLERAGRPDGSGRDTIALVYGVGIVMRGESSYDPFSGMTTMGSEDVAHALRSATDDPRVVAIVFRVDSPGGSYVASDTIWREVTRARAVGKPVVVSMGDVAASGGYFVSMNADRIVAQPGTITASIGVLGGKLVTRELWSKLGVTFDETHLGNNALMWSGQNRYTESGRERRDAFLDAVYEDFTTRVAEGRSLDLERVREIARGRIWTGEDALELGLVDELGGMDAAIRAAREAAGLEAAGVARVSVYPKSQTPVEALLDRGPDSSEDRVAASIARVLERVRPMIQVLDEAGLWSPQAGVLTTPEPRPRP